MSKMGKRKLKKNDHASGQKKQCPEYWYLRKNDDLLYYISSPDHNVSIKNIVTVWSWANEAPLLIDLAWRNVKDFYSGKLPKWLIKKGKLGELRDDKPLLEYDGEAVHVLTEEELSKIKPLLSDW